MEVLLANCMAHGRRQFVEVAANFPDQCRYVLDMLGQVYGRDAEARVLTTHGGAAADTATVETTVLEAGLAVAGLLKLHR